MTNALPKILLLARIPPTMEKYVCRFLRTQAPRQILYAIPLNISTSRTVCVMIVQNSRQTALLASITRPYRTDNVLDALAHYFSLQTVRCAKLLLLLLQSAIQVST